MERSKKRIDSPKPGQTPPKGTEKPALLTFSQSQESDIAFIKDLALREIGKTPQRLHLHKTFLIHLDGRKVGFVSYCRADGSFLYLYMLALEKEAQNKGYAHRAVKWVIGKESKLAPVNGIKIRVLKTNQQALYATQEKFGYKIIEELPRHYVLTRPVLGKQSKK